MSNLHDQKTSLIDIDFTLRRVFGKSSFRPFQREIITATLDRYDVFVQAATSFGKSLCFQLPAVIDHGITIVISPLLALMNNQVAALEAAHIPVATLNSTSSLTDRSAVIKDLCCGHPYIRLLYITPEYTLTLSFQRCLQVIHAQRELARFVIDEAHCISEWGHDFRRAYSRLSYLRAAYPSIPIMCLTATATPSVRASIISNLCLDPTNLRFFSTNMSRPNLHYEVRFNSDASDTRFHQLVTWLAEIHSRRASDPRKLELTTTSSCLDAFSGIIYVPLRSDCDALASRLRLHNIGAAPYHAGLSALDRTNCEQKWIANAPGYDVIVATTAFGMGIDKQDVRFVVHWGIPKSFEGYYQEAGRAGRDGKAAICVLFYSREERDRVAWRVGKDFGCVIDVGTSSHFRPGHASCRGTQVEPRAQSFGKLISYCETVDKCRHLLISEFFAEKEMPICDFACDFCKDRKSLIDRKRAGLATKDHISTHHQNPELLRQGCELNSAFFPG